MVWPHQVARPDCDHYIQTAIFKPSSSWEMAHAHYAVIYVIRFNPVIHKWSQLPGNPQLIPVTAGDMNGHRCMWMAYLLYKLTRHSKKSSTYFMVVFHLYELHINVEDTYIIYSSSKSMVLWVLTNPHFVHGNVAYYPTCMAMVPGIYSIFEMVSHHSFIVIALIIHDTFYCCTLAYHHKFSYCCCRQYVCAASRGDPLSYATRSHSELSRSERVKVLRAWLKFSLILKLGYYYHNGWKC